MQASGGRQFPGIEIGMGVQPKHAQRLALIAAMARDRCNRSDAQTVIAAQQNRHALFGQLSIHGIMHLVIPGGDLRQIAVAVNLDQAGIGRSTHIAAIHHVQSALRQGRMNSGDP